MKLSRLLKGLLLLVCIGVISTVYAQEKEVLSAVIRINADSVEGRVNPNIYGQMLENCGNCLYPGLWVGENSEIPNTRGMRNDVLEKFREIKTPIVRWPGGTPSEYYHWMDGVGPKQDRPESLLTGLCLASPGEKNQFGTDEYMDFCRLIGASPYICANVGTGTPEEAGNWIEYCNRTGNTQYAALRKKNGNCDPYGVKYWGIGNESYFWHTPDSYALAIKQYAKIMKTMADTSISLIAAGLNDPHIKGADTWNSTILGDANEFLDYISLHAYHMYDDYYDVVASPLKTQIEIDKLRKLIKKLVPADNRLEITVDEWNIWHKEAKINNGLMQKCTLMDGLFAAGMFHVFLRNSDIVTMANFCDLVNQLPAIVTSEDGSLYTNPIFSAFKLYTNHSGNIILKSETEVDAYRPNEAVGEFNVPYLDCSATLFAENGHLSLAVINRHKDRDIETRIHLGNFNPESKAHIYVLNAAEHTTANDFNEPDNVVIKEIEAIEVGANFSYMFPAHSITIIEVSPK